MIEFSRRQALGASSAALLGGVLPIPARAQQDPLERLLPHVAPELRPFVSRMQQYLTRMPAFSPANLAMIRTGAAARNQPPLASPSWENVQIPGPSGEQLSLFVVNRSAGSSKPAILHTHGGGFIVGSAQADLPNLQAIAARLDCVIVSVEYGLAPETGWRGSVAENYAGLKWLHDNAAALGADRARIAVMGESAGGGHAALLAQVAHDRGEVPICFQCLVYPMLDDRTGTRTIPPYPAGQLIWTEQSNRFGWESFLGMAPGTASVPVEAVPARRASLAGLPPSWIGVGSIDLFCDEDIDYAQRLNGDGVPTELVVVPGAFHGFDVAGAGIPIADRFTESKLLALARAFGTTLLPA